MTFVWNKTTNNSNKNNLKCINKKNNLNLLKYTSINILHIKKMNFKNNTNISIKSIKTNNIKINNLRKKIHLFFFKMFVNEKNIHLKKSESYLLSNIFFNFFISHDINVFNKKISYVLMGGSKTHIMAFVRKFQSLNKTCYDNMFKLFNIKGFYIKISGKFNGFGGAKKLKKHIIVKKIKFTDVNIKTHRSVNNIQHKSGLTTISSFVSHNV